MEMMMDYVKPELLVLVPVLYILGTGLKRSRMVADERIPAALGGVGMGLCALWLLGSPGPAADLQGWAMLAFTAIVQGLLVAGMAVYGNQLAKQQKKAAPKPPER